MDANVAQGNKRGGAMTDLDHYYQMRELGVEEKVKKFPWAGVNKEHLDLISCIQMDNMDVDKVDAHCGGASADLFFEPSGPIDDEFKDILSQHWFDLGVGEDNIREAPWKYPKYRSTWFTNPWGKAAILESDDLHIDRHGGTAWLCMSDRWGIAELTNLKLPVGFINCSHTHEYFSDFAFFPKDDNKPHLACIIGETFVSPGPMLRSEIHGAVALVMYQLATWPESCGDHHTKPVMLYTFQSDQYARITQAYFDRNMDKIVLRQSRQFDLRGPKPTEDAWLLLRWMLNTPVGDTMVKQEVKQEVKQGVCSLPIRAKEPAATLLKPTCVALCLYIQPSLAKFPGVDKLWGPRRSGSSTTPVKVAAGKGKMRST